MGPVPLSQVNADLPRRLLPPALVRASLLATSGVLLLTGCAAVAPFTSLLSTPVGAPPAQVQTQTRVELTQADFVLVKTNVVGRSRGFSLLGLITIVPATVTKAMHQFYGEAEMVTGRPQTSAHLMIEHSSSYYILFGIPQVDVSADIVQFAPAPESGSGNKQARPAP